MTVYARHPRTAPGRTVGWPAGPGRVGLDLAALYRGDTSVYDRRGRALAAATPFAGTDLGPGRYDLILYRGDTYAWQFKFWKDANRTVPVNLTGWLVAAQIRSSPGAQPIAQLTCTITAPNIVNVSLPAAVSQMMPSGFWDLEVRTTSSTTVATLLRGAVTVTDDITRTP